MKFEAVQSSGVVDEWRVEAIAPEGEVYVALFSGPQAQQRAQQYAKWRTDTFTSHEGKRWNEKTWHWEDVEPTS